jgi:hypothetical protein
MIMHSYKIGKINLEESFHGEAYKEGKCLKSHSLIQIF